MTKIKTRIAKIFSKKNIKIWSVFLIFVFLFVSQTYASNELLDKTVDYMRIIMALLSRVWIVLANLAGALMTNNILYWTFLHLDASLRTLRNIMKNFANFALWFMVLFAIVRNIIFVPSSKEGERSVKKILPRTLIAGVLIQASWFLMWAVVDVSTIITSAIWTFPSQFIAWNSEFQWATKNASTLISKNNKIKFTPWSTWELLSFSTDTSNLQTEDDVKAMLDTILPSHNSVSGPLMFLWISVFGFNDYEVFGSEVNPESPITDWGDLFLSVWLSGAVLIFFTLMMFFIFLFNLFRLIMLRIIIPLLPIIILLKVFKLTDKLSWWWKWMDIWKFMDIKTILKLIFKPVIMVWALSLVLVILVLMKSMIAGNKVHNIKFEDQWNVQIISQQEGSDKLYTSTIKSDGIFDFSMTWVKDTFADIIVYVFGLFLIFLLVKLAVKSETWIWFIDKSLNNIMESLETTLKTLPVVPIWGWAVWINAIKDAFSSGNVSGMATRLMWVDVGKQTDIMNKILKLEGSFSSLHERMQRDVFIREAASIAKTLGLSGTSLKTNDMLTKKIRERNSVLRFPSQNIEIQNIIDAMNQTPSEPAEGSQQP